MTMRRLLLFFCLSVYCVCCASTATADEPQGAPPALRLLGERVLPSSHTDGSVLGGLSAIDFNAARNEWIVASDDRAEHGPARFYRLRMTVDEHGIGEPQWLATVAWHQLDGRPYARQIGWRRADGAIADIEAVRYDPRGGLWYSSEGNEQQRQAPFIRYAGVNGDLIASLPLPAQLLPHGPWGAGQTHGARLNRNLEGLSLAPDGRSLWLALEAPLHQDGAPASATQGAYTRLLHLTRNGRVLGQFAYPLDPIPWPAEAGRASDNGVAELLCVDDTQLLVLERAGRQTESGGFVFDVRLYVADLAGATDVRTQDRLGQQPYVAASKRLLLHLNTVPGLRVDNLEGMAWGPPLSNGNRTLVLIADDNFDHHQTNQLLAFEVTPEARLPTPRKPQ
jgi:hypothetical protein